MSIRTRRNRKLATMSSRAWADTSAPLCHLSLSFLNGSYFHCNYKRLMLTKGKLMTSTTYLVKNKAKGFGLNVISWSLFITTWWYLFFHRSEHRWQWGITYKLNRPWSCEFRTLCSIVFSGWPFASGIYDYLQSPIKQHLSFLWKL